MFGFYYREVLMQFLTLPLKLTQGDIDQNLRVLRDTDDNDLEHVSKRWKTYLLSGGTHEALVKLLQIVKASPTTTKLAEQGLSSGKILAASLGNPGDAGA